MGERQINMESVSFEPLRSNRFIIKFYGMDIPPYLFKSYKFLNVGGEIIFITEFFETCNHTFNPQDIFNVIEVVVERLDPSGVLVQGLKFDVKGVNFVQKGDYSQDSLLTTKVRMVVKENSLNKLYNDEIVHGNG